MNHPFKDFLNDIREDWRDDALCAQSDPEAFFPEKGGSIREAKRICSACDVRKQCLDFALRTNQPEGIWGGVPPKQRRKLRRNLNMPPVPVLDLADWHGTEAGARRHHREGTKLCQRCSEAAQRARRERAQRGLAS